LKYDEATKERRGQYEWQNVGEADIGETA